MQITNVERVPCGKVNVYLIYTDNGPLLVDTGMPGSAEKVEQRLRRRGMELTDLLLIFLTHVHYDHLGSAADIKRRSGAPVIMQQEEAEAARRGVSVMPRGATPLGRKVVGVVDALGKNEGSFEPVEPDYTFAEEYDLMPFGVAAKLFHTPGHSAGSASLVGEEKGLSFVGDILFGIWLRSVMPPFADNPELLPASWRILLEHGAQHFYPGHGRSFDKERLLRELWRRERERKVD
jgi:glyoxylase-like metal-dependent hydrolase (beta-lactamase superfamily II)